MDIFLMERWSPYAVGALIGILNIAALKISDKPLGASTSYLKLSGIIRKLFQKESVQRNEYYKKKTPELDWGIMLVIGVVIGAFISSYTSGSFRIEFVPATWQTEISSSVLLRLSVSLLGGILLGIGSRWAGGCTSGHGISGTSQMSLLSWIATICFFIGGIITSYIVYLI